MDLKEQIIKFLNEETSQVRTLDSEGFAITLDNYKEDTEYLADELIKLFSLHSVSESLLAKCWNCQYFETRGKNYAKNTIGHCHKQDCKVSYPKHQYCDNYKQSDNFR